MTLVKTVKEQYERGIVVEIRRIHGAGTLLGNWSPSLLVFKRGKLHQTVEVQLFDPNRGFFKDSILIEVPNLDNSNVPLGFMAEEG